ncbi:MAG: hypothetical protein JNJ43_15895 [Anaerolineales bacterium]|nr:hypothetical protein [Anaerolineales bacterium]
MDEGSGSNPENKALRVKRRFRLKEVLIKKNWLIDVFGNLMDALFLVLEINSINSSFGLLITRVVVYTFQIFLTLLLSGRPHPKSVNFYNKKALLLQGFFICRIQFCTKN